MEAPINRYPGGLLGFLDIKAMGENPRTLSTVVQPLVDLTPYYLGSKRVTLTSLTANVTGLGLFASTTPVVQGSDAFLMTNIQVTGATLAAGENIRFYACVLASPISTPFYTGPMSQAFVTGDSVSEGWSLPTPVILPPGSILAIQATRIGTALPGLIVNIGGIQIQY